MKKLKFAILTIVLFLMPTLGNALTDDEATLVLNKISSNNESGSYVINANSIDPDLIMGNRCVYTRDRLISENPENSELVGDELTNRLAEDELLCKNNYYYAVLDFYLKSIDINSREINLSMDFTDKNHVKITLYNEMPITFRDFTINYVSNYDNKVLDEVNSIIPTLKSGYTIYGLSVLNTVYHYGPISNVIYDNDYVLYRFPEFKKTMEKYSKYSYSLQLRGLGATPTITGSEFWLGIFKDNVLFGINSTGFSMNHVLYVSDNSEGTVYEKAEARIKEYFGDRVDVNVSNTPDYVFEDEEFINKEINKYLGVSNGSYTGYSTNVSIGNTNHSILIVEIPEDKLDIVNIKAKDYTTGVNIDTKSPDVPLDATINVNDVSDSEYVVKATTDNNLEIIKGYDINLKKTGTNTLIKDIPDGVLVYIPVIDKKVGDKVNIYYIKADSSIGETIEGKVVEIDNQLYAEFKTTHFSTYVIANKIEKEIEEPIVTPEEPIIKNPNTFDNITNSILLLVVSFIGILILIKNYRRSTN